jgi:hypothetical protein
VLFGSVSFFAFGILFFNGAGLLIVGLLNQSGQNFPQLKQWHQKSLIASMSDLI